MRTSCVAVIEAFAFCGELQAVRGGSLQASAGAGRRASMELRASELAMILDGIDISKLKRVPRYARINRKTKKEFI